ncbi:MAG: hypothetical protein KGS45_08775 [Planctomycetes bacterium]|nr:hypothetical protein [Planctomycetota bacterium]
MIARLPLIFITATLFAAPVIAQPASTPEKTESKQPRLSTRQRTEKLAELASKAFEAFRQGRHAEAETFLREQLAIAPTDPIALYNLACVLGAQRKNDEAGIALAEAITNGYVDLRRIRRDPFVATARLQDAPKSLIDNWPRTLDNALQRTIDLSQPLAPKSSPIRDETLKVAFLCAFDEQSCTDARSEITSIGTWAIANIFPTHNDSAELALDPWALIVLPTRAAFERWSTDTYGPRPAASYHAVGGAYDHDTKRLIAQDLGSTLRHEFLHVLHWRDMTRRSQIHPVWVQEGLCSLMEDYDFLPDGSLTPAHSWRTTTAKRLLGTGTLPSLSTLTAMTREAFSQNRPLTNYALARTLFLYLHEQGKLGTFYSSLCSTYPEDPTGTLALERTFAKPISDINTDFRAALRSTPDIPEQITSGMASLGVEITAGTGEGPIVTLSPSASPLRSGDVLVGLNSPGQPLHPIRDIPELIRLLSRQTPGDTIQVTLRRGKTRLTLDLPLVAK